MSEIPGPSPEEIHQTEPESRFGNKPFIETAIDKGKARLIGLIDEVISGIAPHRNRVHLAYVDMELAGSRNKIELAVIDTEQGEILCVFKPLDGEDETFHKQNELGHDYEREAAAYIVSELFKFDLVPPTVVKEIDGRIGSLQQFIDREKYLTSRENKQNEDSDIIAASDDIMKLCVFDWMIGNFDRHIDNFLINIENDEGALPASKDPTIIAIDNGAAFNQKTFRISCNTSRSERDKAKDKKFEDKANAKRVPGPYLHLTNDLDTFAPKEVPIPDWLMTLLLDGRSRIDEFREALKKNIDTGEVDGLISRLDLLIDKGVFLSGNNFDFQTQEIA